MADTNTTGSAQATGTDPLKAAMAAAGMEAPAQQVASPMPLGLADGLKPIQVDKPVNGKEMRDMLSDADRAKAQSVAKALKIDEGLQATQFGLDSQKSIAEFTGRDAWKRAVAEFRTVS